nr:DNA topoisomerase 1 alpha-like [Tanacetum cinerariifolium]
MAASYDSDRSIYFDYDNSVYFNKGSSESAYLAPGSMLHQETGPVKTICLHIQWIICRLTEHNTLIVVTLQCQLDILQHLTTYNSHITKALMKHTVDKGFTIHGWELGNELSTQGIGAKIRADRSNDDEDDDNDCDDDDYDDDDDDVPNQKTKKQTLSSSKSSSVNQKESNPSKVPPGFGEGKKWTSLVHNGVIFPPAYKPYGVKMPYKGKPVDLTPEQEEEKKNLRGDKMKLQEKYTWAIVDGVKEKVGNSRVEPPGV